MSGKEETFFDKVEVELVSSPNEFKEWTEMPACQDYMNQLNAWLKDAQFALEDPDNVLLDKTLHRLGGNTEALRRAILLFDTTLANLEDDIREI